MNRNDVIDVLSTIAVGDRRTVGPTDIAFWEQIIGKLPKDFAMQAVADHFRDCPGVWLEPGHVVQRVKTIRREMYERESDEERSYRQSAQAVKAADEMRGIAAGAVMGQVKKKTKRLLKAEDALQTCRGKRESMAAIQEFWAAKAEAKKR